MKEEIYNSYSMMVDEITENANGNYQFSYHNHNYFLLPCYYDDQQINQSLSIAKMLKEKLAIDSLLIVLTKSGAVVNDNKQVLLETNDDIFRPIDLEDLEKYNKIKYYHSKLIDNWASRWASTIDHIESLLDKKANIDIDVLVITNFFIGLGECAIQMFNSNFQNSFPVVPSHKIFSNGYFDLINPLNYHWNYECYDYAEYIKKAIINNRFDIGDIKYILTTKKWNYQECNIFLSGILFCDSFFESLDLYIEKKNNIIKNYLQIANNYERSINEIINVIFDYYKKTTLFVASKQGR